MMMGHNQTHRGGGGVPVDFSPQWGPREANGYVVVDETLRVYVVEVAK